MFNKKIQDVEMTVIFFPSRRWVEKKIQDVAMAIIFFRDNLETD